MKQKLISRLSMISVCALLCLCIVCAKQDNTSFSPYPIESLSSAIPKAAQLDSFPDFTVIPGIQDEENTQDVSIIEYTAHTTLTSPVSIFCTAKNEARKR